MTSLSFIVNNNHILVWQQLCTTNVVFLGMPTKKIKKTMLKKGFEFK